MGKVEKIHGVETINGEGFQLTVLDKVIGAARANSMWPLPFATSCCGIEYMATMGSNYDVARFGMERMSFSPRQADLLIVAGTISKKLAPVLKQVYEQMAEPKWVLSVGACACSGGIFDTYSVLQGIDRVIPVDVYVPGCPPRPEQIIEGMMNIHRMVKNESLRRRYSDEYKHLLNKYHLNEDE
ncbi:MAG: NADH-quinone oxidoreductase subunit B [Fluviicola sp.]|jgi:NADH-quinone oxidoreductase subunit B|nr:NADH-quinone oxidoreductase subunit B [Fluviicola sp.]